MAVSDVGGDRVVKAGLDQGAAVTSLGRLSGSVVVLEQPGILDARLSGRRHAGTRACCRFLGTVGMWC